MRPPDGVFEVSELCQIASWQLASDDHEVAFAGLQLVTDWLPGAVQADAERRREAGEWRPT